MIEQKEIPNSKGYIVTTDGRVFRNGKELSCNPAGIYKSLTVFFKDGTRKRRQLHVIIAELFIENPEGKPFVNHKDLNKHNNDVSNLEWVTNAENCQHASENGVNTCENGPRAKLTNLQVHEICRKLEEGYRSKDIALDYNISPTTLSQIKRGVQWKEISKQYTFKKGRRNFSEETIRWICEMLSQGKRFKEIKKEARNPNITIGLIDSLLQKNCYKDIVCDYEFK